MRPVLSPTRVRFGAALLASAALFFFPGLSSGQSKPPAKQPAKKSTSSAKPSTATKKKSPVRRSSRSRAQSAPTAERIREIQTALVREGHLKGEPTGKWDAATVDALKAFQTANELNANGKLDARTLQKLGLGSEVAGMAPPRPAATATEEPHRQ